MGRTMTTEQSTPNFLERSIELLWGSRERPARGPKPGLTLDRIVRTAIAVADVEGLEALSMRRLARELGVGTMSLYRYVPGKPELLALMLDQVSDPSAEVEKTAVLDWRAALEVIATASRALYLAHPWLVHVHWPRPVIGPNALAGLDHFVSVLDGLGLSDQERIAVMTTLDSYVTGVVRSQVLYASAAEQMGVSDEEFWAKHHPVLERAILTGEYPTLAAMAEDSFDASWDDNFQFGLQRLLDGIQTLVESRSS
jgi:AcrR family transcriptional regulator